jgi:hypothetical protein
MKTKAEKLNASYAIEKNAYNAIQPLKANIVGNKDAILTNRKLFNSTLQ